MLVETIVRRHDRKVPLVDKNVVGPTATTFGSRRACRGRLDLGSTSSERRSHGSDWEIGLPERVRL